VYDRRKRRRSVCGGMSFPEGIPFISIANDRLQGFTNTAAGTFLDGSYGRPSFYFSDLLLAHGKQRVCALTATQHVRCRNGKHAEQTGETNSKVGFHFTKRIPRF